MSFKIYKSNEVAREKHQEIRDLFGAATADWPAYKTMKWAAPNYTALFETSEGWLAAYHIVSRLVRIDGQKYHIAGLSHLITHTAYRNRHMATLGLSAAESFIFDTIKADLALILCPSNLIPFFQRLGWQITHATVTYQQDDVSIVWPEACLILPAYASPLASIANIQHIDLMGKIF